MLLMRPKIFLLIPKQVRIFTTSLVKVFTFCLATAFCLVALLWSAQAKAQTQTQTQTQACPQNLKCFRVQSIEVEGLVRTRKEVVLKELYFSQEDVVSEQDLEQATQDLKNLWLFSSVMITKTIINDGAVQPPVKNIHLLISVKEKWTLIPIVKFSGSEDDLFYTIGIYDINSMGRNLELGMQYENFSGADSGVVWFRAPNVFRTRTRLGADFWMVKRKQELFDVNGHNVGNYTFSKQKIQMFVDKKIRRDFVVGLTLDFQKNEIEQTDLELGQADKSFERVLPKNQQQLVPRVYFKVGELNYDNYLVNGGIFQGDIASDGDFTEVLLAYKHFYRWGVSSNLAFQFLTGYSDTQVFQNYFHLGGFESVRGFNDGQFSNRQFWQINGEYRFTSLRGSWWVLQNIFFTDVANSDYNFLDLWQTKRKPYYSMGAGVRLIFPKLHGVILRFDYALGGGRKNERGFFFGLQQFF